MKFNNDLVIKAQSGDIWAYENIVNEFSAMAKGYAYSILKDYHYAEDVAQESFALAFFKLKMLQSPEAFPSWFRKIVFSQCEHFYRKKRLPVVPFDVFYDTESLEQSPLDIVERNELRTRIIKAIKSLPEKSEQLRSCSTFNHMEWITACRRSLNFPYFCIFLLQISKQKSINP